MPYRLSLVSALAVITVAAAQPKAPRTPVELPPIVVTPSMPAAFRLLTAPAVQKDVGLSAGQREAADSLAAEWAMPADTWGLRGLGWLTPVQARAETARRTTAFLTKTLTRDQARRVDQIAYQLREKEFGAHAMFIASSGPLGLRDDQAEDIPNIQQARVEEITKLVTSGDRFAAVKTKVTASNADTYEKMAEMLTRTQREKLKELRGQPFDGAVDPNFFTVPASAIPRVMRSAYPARSFGDFDFELEYLKSAAVQRELKGTADQIEGWNRLPRPNPDAVHVAETEKNLLRHLTPEQMKRFHELMIRRRQVLGGVEGTLGYPLVVEKLRLTGSQLEALRTGATASDILTPDQEKLRAGLLGEPFEFEGLNTDEYFEAFRRARAVANRAKLNAPRPPGPIDESPTLVRALLLLSGRLELSDAQIKQLREIAEDEPRMKELIDKELGYPDGQHTVGADRGLWTVHAVQSKYKDAVETQSWKVLDAKQQSMAKKMMGRGK